MIVLNRVTRSPWVWATLAVDTFFVLLLAMTCIVLSSGFSFLPWYESSGLQFIWTVIVLVPYVGVFLLLLPLHWKKAATFQNLIAPLLAVLILAPTALAGGGGPVVLQLAGSLAVLVWVLWETVLIWRTWFIRSVVGDATTGDAA